ncbi:MAG: hemolysin family protein [Phycisphaeraceae bacterium]
MNVSAGIWIALAAAVLACYFATCSIALRSFSRKRLADVLNDREQGHRLEPFLDRLSELTLLSSVMRAALNLIVLLGAYYFVQPWFGEQQAWAHYLVAFLLATGIVSVFSVAIPHSWARYRREEVLARSIPMLNALLMVARPLTAVLGLLDPVVRRISGAELDRPGREISDQVLSVVEEHEAADVDDVQKEMLEAVFELPNTTAGEIMTPRTDIHGIEITSSLEDVKAAVIDFGHSRIPVYEGNLDNIVGILYAKDLISFLGNGQTAFDLRAVKREAYMVPESKSVRELLAEFKGRKVHLAIVLDEYGGTAGLVTIEDILEELVGEIQDEYEPLEQLPEIHPVDDRTADVDARLRIGELNDAMDLELPEDEDYDTVGGFVFSTLGHIPDTGESFDYDNVRFTVTDVDRTKVKRVRLERQRATTESNAANDS